MMKKQLIIISIFLLCIGNTLKAQSTREGLRALEFEKYEEAKSVFLNLVKNNQKEAAENYYYLGQVYTAVDNFDSAAIAYNAGIAADEKEGLNYAGLGELKLLEKKTAEATADFEKALKITKEKNVKTMRAISSAYLKGENTDKALEYADKAVELNKADAETYILVGDIYLAKQDGGKSATNYERAIYYDPNNPKPHVRVANIWLQVKNPDATMDALNKALALDSNYAPAHKSLSRLYYLAKKFDKARAEYNKYLELSEPSIANKRQFINILFLGGFYNDALSIINEILPVDSNDIFLYRLKGYSIYETGQENKIDSAAYYQPGIVSLEKFISQAKADKIVASDYTYLGKLYLKTGMDSVAILNFEKALAIDSNQADVYIEIGKLKADQRKYGEAAEYYQKGINKKTRPAILDYYYLARALYFDQQYAKSDSAWSMLIELQPKYIDAYYWRGVCNASLDPEYKDTVAKSMYEQYVALAETDPKKNKKNLVDSYTFLGVYYVKKDNNADAKIYFEKILALEPENKFAKDALAGIK